MTTTTDMFEVGAARRNDVVMFVIAM